MGCGGSINQVYDNSAHLNESTRPLKLMQFISQDQSIIKPPQNQVYLFGQTRTQRVIMKMAIKQAQKQQLAVLQKIHTKHRIPKPKIKYDPIQLLYQQAQEVIPLNMYNSTSLPPFNLMFTTFLSFDLIFMCGGTDYEFWNPVKQSFIYRILQNNNQNSSIKVLITGHTQKTIRRQFNKFQRLAFMKTARYSHMGIFIRQKQSSYIYVFGGYDEQKQALSSCQRYSFQKDQWEQIFSMNIARATGFCFQFMNKIYVFGGFTKQGKRSKKIQLYNIQKKGWEILNVKLHQGIQQGFISTINPNQIIMVGGNTQGGQTFSTLRVNIVEQTYEWITDLKYKGSLQKGLTYNKKIYIFGGWQMQKCQVYSDISTQWDLIQVKFSQPLKKEDTYMFSYTTQSLHIQYKDNQRNQCNEKQKQLKNNQNYYIFCNDQYPLMLQVIYDEKQIKKQSVPMTLRLRHKMGVLKIDDVRYFICGGIDTFSTKATKGTFIYNSQTKKAKQMGKMANKKIQFSLCRKNQFIYCFGGKIIVSKQAKVVGQCQKFNLWSGKWQKINSLFNPRYNCQTVVLSESIIVYGGYFEQQLLSSIQVYNISANTFYFIKDKLKILNPITSFCIFQQETQCKICILSKKKQEFHLENYLIKINEIQVKAPNKIQSIGKLVNQNSCTIQFQDKQQISLKQIKHQEQQISQNKNINKEFKQFEVQIKEYPIILPTNTIQIKAKKTLEEEEIQFQNPNFNKNQPILVGLQDKQQKKQMNKKQMDKNQLYFSMTEDQKQIYQKLKEKKRKKENIIDQQQKVNKIHTIQEQRVTKAQLLPFQITRIETLNNLDKQERFYYIDQSFDNKKRVCFISKKDFVSFNLVKLQAKVIVTDFRTWKAQYSQKWPELINLNCKSLNFQINKQNESK